MGINTTSIKAAALSMEEQSARLGPAAALLVSRFGTRMRDAIAARAPGAQYPSTIRRGPVQRQGSRLFVTVGSDRHDAWRRERGFHGTDSKGRRYNQRGKAHFGPGFDVAAPLFQAAVTELFEER